MGGGLQRDDVEVSISADATVPNQDVVGMKTITGLASAVQAWSDGATNYGWAIFNDSTNGWDFNSSDFGTASLRPQLIIDYTVNVPPTAADNTVVTLEDTAHVFTVADFNFSDPDPGNTLQHIRITSLETAGALQLSSVDVVLNQVIDVADIIAGNLTFTPVPDANGAGYDSFGFKVSDGEALAAGTELSSFVPPNVSARGDMAWFARQKKVTNTPRLLKRR